MKHLIRKVLKENFQKNSSYKLYNYIEKAQTFLTYTKSVVEEIEKMGEEISISMKNMVGENVDVRIDADDEVMFITNLNVAYLTNFIKSVNTLAHRAMDELETTDFNDVIEEIKRNDYFITEYVLDREIDSFLGSKLAENLCPDIQDGLLVFKLISDFEDRVSGIEEICDLMLDNDII